MSELECITIKREKFNAKSVRCMRLVIVISISDSLVPLSDIPHLAAMIMSFRILEYIRFWETHPSSLKCRIRPQVYLQLEMTFAHIPHYGTASPCPPMGERGGQGVFNKTLQSVLGRHDLSSRWSQQPQLHRSSGQEQEERTDRNPFQVCEIKMNFIIIRKMTAATGIHFYLASVVPVLILLGRTQIPISFVT